jgi:hypothetical protein
MGGITNVCDIFSGKLKRREQLEFDVLMEESY